MTRVLLALDGTDASGHVADAARRLFGDGVEYLAIHVADDPVETSSLTWGAVYGYTFAPTSGYVERLASSATRAVDDAEREAARSASAAGIDADSIGAVGSPAAAVSRAAVEHGADVIVVGHHRRGWFASLLDPSVADDVTDQAKVPVLVVPIAD